MRFSYRPLSRDESTPSAFIPDSSHKQVYVPLPVAWLLLAGSIISVTLNLVTLYIWIHSTGPFNPLFPQALYSPAQDVLEYKTVKFHSGFGPDLPIYDQPPSDEVDKAWESLYEFAYSKIPRNQAIRLANKTYPILGDEQEYVLALDVFHELHCLDEIRKAMHPDYYPHTTEGINTNHMRHCISSLRQSIMCTADISTIVWQWSERSQAAKERADVLHTCRNFEKIQEWGRDHFAGAMQDMTIYIPDDLNVVS
ncbi:hypothetical protein C8F04DRAFT_1076762 [Mycena alexandri]|uniref:Cyclochlorotine biosynthesis protein O n=1 Tax=Mycena alexandri TaxID=1745969 RepID=A0AAD6TAT6_9AGAR|nr:hypothetical protein C8F04DRAFT_1076762 [Mycena alexandri]